MKVMAKVKAKASTNGKIEKLSPERLAELFVPTKAIRAARKSGRP